MCTPLGNFQISTEGIAMRIQCLLLLAIVCLSACSSMPAPKMVVASSVEKEQVQALNKKMGAVADVLTVTGEEHYFVIETAADGTLGGHLVDPVQRSVLPDQDFRAPFDDIAVVYYVEQPKSARAKVPGTGQRRLVPNKPAYPKLAMPGPREKNLSCDALGVDLARAEAVRWFARNQGAMGYTPEQAALRHATNAAEYTAITAIVLLALASGAAPNINFSPPQPLDPNRTLATQIGEENLRWSVTAADSRIIALLQLRRDRGCADRPTLTGFSDLQNLVALDGLRQGRSAAHLSDQARMHEQTRLLDELGPLALPESSNRNCGVFFHCPVRWQAPPHREDGD
jgi:hypothetical protein